MLLNVAVAMGVARGFRGKRGERAYSSMFLCSYVCGSMCGL